MNPQYDVVNNTVASTPPSSKSSMSVDELLGRLLVDTLPAPQLEHVGEPTPASIPADIVDEFSNQMNDILSGSKNNPTISSSSANTPLNVNYQDYYHERMKIAFEKYELECKESDQRKEFESIEAFILEEQRRSLQQRKAERKVKASEEIRLAADIAELKGFRFKSDARDKDTLLQEKISDTERSYFQRKMVVAKAAQLANSDSREQFQRARAFFETLHKSRQASLRRSYERSRKVMAITHQLCGTDPRVVELEQQSAERMFRKKEANLNELHMAQNLEEASYLETMFGLLNKVTKAKEDAATEIFQLEIAHLKAARSANDEMAQQLHDLQAEAVLKMAELVAHFAVEQNDNTEDDILKGQNVARAERKKDFDSYSGCNASGIHSVSELYDNIMWSAAISRLGFSTTGSSIYTEDEDVEDEENVAGDEKDKRETSETSADLDENSPMYLMGSPDDSWGNESSAGIHEGSKRFSDEGSAVTGSTGNTSGTGEEDLSVLGKIHVRRLKSELKAKEQALVSKHSALLRDERRKYRKAKRELKLYHQSNVDRLLQECVDERYRLREEITARLASLEANQELDSKTLQESIDADIALMQDAWAEHKRLENAEKSSFEKAQALVSAQVFHEVRNALSSVIAMSELTSQLRDDPTVTPDDMVCSVNKMLDQNEEVVHYSLTMLNNILDINKIRTGEFEISKDIFDLTDLMQRATTMQMAKAESKGVKMRFETPKMGKCLVSTDRDIVLRIITNFISNAVKFTSAPGAIQPFIVPLEDLMPNESDSSEKRVAVGVADSGIGLDREMLDKAKAGLYNSDTKGTSSGAKNSGFGLHLAHQLAGTLGTNIYLTGLSQSHGVLNDDISEAFRLRMKEDSNCGTVLFVTIPVFDKSKSKNPFRRKSSLEGEILPYEFSPKAEVTNKFRILIADDVLMLRKGLVRSVLELFQKKNVPVLVHTACTAEDAARVINSQSYDIIIADNQYSPPDNTKQLEVDEERPHILLGEDETTKIGESVKNFFRSESFTMEEGDGELSGLQVMQQLLEVSSNGNDTSNTPPIPILILLSGHKFDLSSEYQGLIVAQKPLRTSEIVPLLEANAQQLLESGLCIKEVNESGEGYRILNQRGTQIFCSCDDM